MSPEHKYILGVIVQLVDDAGASGITLLQVSFRSKYGSAILCRILGSAVVGGHVRLVGGRYFSANKGYTKEISQ
jgi:hypothetical protein